MGATVSTMLPQVLRSSNLHLGLFRPIWNYTHVKGPLDAVRHLRSSSYDQLIGFRHCKCDPKFYNRHSFKGRTAGPTISANGSRGCNAVCLRKRSTKNAIINVKKLVSLNLSVKGENMKPVKLQIYT